MDSLEAIDPDDTEIGKSSLRFPVVGIGASAGGLTALQRLFEAIPADTTMAFVVVMHLSPDHESALGSILQRWGRLPVTTVVESLHIEAGHVYVISPSLRLTMTDGELTVAKLQTLDGRRRSIDLFFRSLAQAHQARAVCIVLSGTGSDGAQGLKRIKERGGVAFAQSPEDAEFDSMPRAAIQTGVVDFVMPVAEMPPKLCALWQNAQRIALPDPPADLKAEVVTGEAELLAEEALISIKALLRERTGHDFAHYKRGTVLRRLERRMQVNALPDLPSYRRLLDAEPRETPALLQDMLISVTNFFRDPDAFRALEAALRLAIGERPPTQPFRAWVAGCATGEEAYSVAILLRELFGHGGTAVQIFASDIDQRAVAAARTGLFPPSIATDVSPERLRDFFVVEPNGFRIVKSVRDSVVFSTHNALSDPPFTRLDLICCRNLLIYLDRSAQSQLLRSFHFSLKPRGLLFLGSSETVDAAEGLFEGEDKTHRIYWASPAMARARILPPMSPRLPLPSLSPSPFAPAEAPRPPLEALHERVVRQYGPATVLVDADDTVLHVSQTAAHLLRLPEGAPSNKLLMLARPELRAELRAALSRAIETGRVVQAPQVRLQVNGASRIVHMTVRPATDESPKGLVLVVFDEAEESMVRPDGPPIERDPVIDSLEAELLRTQDRLRNTVGESAASTEELRASNEELQTINEELRSTTEELETSREELQAVNEELTTVNAELSLRIDETSKANDDLHNLMTSADIGAVFVDRELRVKRFTPQAATIFNLLPADVGRSLLDITHRLHYPQLADDVAVLLRELRRVEREVRSETGRWYIARALPYRTSEDRIEGAVLTFFDISALRAAEDRLRLSEQRMRLVAESMKDYAIITTDREGAITSWSAGAERIFGFGADEAVGRSLDIIFNEEDRRAGEPQNEFRKALETGRADADRWLARKNGERIYCSGIMTPMIDGEVVGFAKIARDFTSAELREKRRDAALVAERANSGRLQEASAMKDEFLAVMSHELKNPLAVIQMNAQLLARLPGLAAEPRALRCAEAIRSAVMSQAQIINDLLELSRGNMGKLLLDPAPLRLGDLVQGVVDAVAPDVAAKSQTITAELADVTVVADAVRVEQIVWNLITNAIKFTPDAGSIRVRLDEDDRMARLTVSDSGIGVEARHLGELFEMFRQVDTGANRKRSGLGIGLALVKQLAELHGGRVLAESDGLGQGTRFKVWLPIAGATDARSPELPVGGALHGVRILLVDDERELLAAFGELLESDGATVALAGSAAQAIEKASSGAFDVVVSDIAMPEQDGYWLAGALRENAATRGLPLIAVSGLAREIDRQRSYAAGFDAHIGKPLDLELLRREIRRTLRLHAGQDRGA